MTELGTDTLNRKRRLGAAATIIVGGAGLISGYCAMSLVDVSLPERRTILPDKPEGLLQGTSEPILSYTNCAAARKAGAAPVRVGEPGYARRLDRDGDGIGCE